MENKPEEAQKSKFVEKKAKKIDSIIKEKNSRDKKKKPEKSGNLYKLSWYVNYFSFKIPECNNSAKTFDDWS